MKFLPSFSLPTLLAVCALALPVSQALAVTPAGTMIGNQASATYSDGSSVTRTVTSNTVITTVQQVASVSVTATGAKTISAGGQVYYPHTLVNTGNGTDTFALTQSNTGTFAFASVLFYADVNGDGLPDNNLPITSTGQLTTGQMYKFVAAGVVPPTAVAGNTNTLTLTATSAFNVSASGNVVDTTTVTGNAVLNVTQSLDVTQGASPAGPRTIILTYTNTGNATATNLTLAEVVPAGMTYVAGSARWSGTGAAVTLTDADKTDNQSGIVYDYGVTVGTRMTAVIASIPAGSSGTLSYQVNINSGLPSGANAATASTGTFTYNDGASTVAASNTNTLQYTVQQTSAVAMTGATVTSTTQGGVVNFTDVVTNNGNGTDSFDITTNPVNTFPAGTTFQLFQADGVTPLVDTNGNGIPDTGPLAAGASVSVVIRATLPTGTSGTSYAVTAYATSRQDPTKIANATNTLGAITGNTVDLTNDIAGTGAPGLGVGPEASAQVITPVTPGATSRVTLVVANGSSVADSFNLQASTDSSFATTTLPSGWSVVFKDSNGAVIDGTGVLAATTHRTVYADVTVASSTAPGTTQLYFRAISPATGAADRLHNAISVSTLRGLVVAPNNIGQGTAGGTMVYTHIISNTGNVLEGDGSVSTSTLATTDSGTSFTSLVYWDKNNSGTLDPTDPVITDLSSLTGGTNGASTAAGLTPGETARLFVKVTAPAGAAPGTLNVTTLTVSTTGVISGIAAPTATLATDSSSVIASQITLVKTQALDADCNGVADTSFSVNSILTGASPGSCIRYEITATNAGPVAVTGLTVSDATPAYTTYHASGVAASATAGTVTAPSDGATGSVQVALGTLASGQSVVLKFGVRITP